jgi:hypothetical protein
MKKTLSLLLAIVMMLSVLVIPAAAAMPKEDAAEPFGRFMDCPKCGSSVRYTDYGIITPSNGQTHFAVQVGSANCTRVSGTHRHFADYAHKYLIDCTYCGAFTYYDFRGCTYHYCDGSGTLIV